MISRLGLAISRAFERIVPDPLVLAIALTALTAILALCCGSYPDAVTSLPARAGFLVDAWRDGSSGIWRLLAFSMQMCLVLVTGHALATAAPIRAGINAVARLPQSSASAAAIVALLACATALINWGLGLIVGALLARAVAQSMRARNQVCHYPLLVAAGYTGLMIWHGGLSGSAPLSMSSGSGAAKVLPSHTAALFPDGVPLTDTLFSSQNLLIALGLLALIPLTMWMLAPADADCRNNAPLQDIGLMASHSDAAEVRESTHRRSIPEFLETSPLLSLLLAGLLAAGLLRFASASSLWTLGLNEVNAAMLAAGLALHGSPRAYMRAAEDAVRGCAGIIIQFPLYAGIMAMMESSGLVRIIAQEMTEHAGERTLPLLSFLSAAIVNLFIPSGGGQWAVQGPIALESGAAAGVAPGTMIMSVAYGDQLTNMLQPFWALPLLALTGAKAREIVGYTAIVMLVGGAWIALGLLVF